MSETKAAFAERTIRSMKIMIYRYMEEYGHKHIQKLSEFFTTLNSRNVCSIEMIPKNIQNSDFLPFCTASHYKNIRKPLQEYKNTGLEIEFAIPRMTYSSGRILSHSLLRKLKKLFHFFPENFQQTQ